MPLSFGGDVFGVRIADPMHRMSIDQARHVAAPKAAATELEEGQ